MRSVLALALVLSGCVLSGCVSYAGKYEALGIANGNVLLLDTETGSLALQEIPEAPQQIPSPKPVI